MICDFMPVSLIDFPGKVATTAFTSGCNFHCPYCHNASLIPNQVSTDKDQAFIAYLEKRRTLLDGVCISGGEPTLHSELPAFIQKIKQLGFAVKLDTNGSNPEMIKYLLNQSALDYIAMDIKAPRAKYSSYTRQPNELNQVVKSVELLKTADIPVEFRTTVVQSLLTLDDFLDIATWLQDASLYVLQGYRYSKGVLNPELCGYKNCEPLYLEEIKQLVQPYFKTVLIK